jgi:periplasmic protein TonB
MSNLRVPFSVVAGVLFSSAVFMALFQFINVPLDVGPPLEARVIEFTKQIADTPVLTKREQKIERPPPPFVPGSGATRIHGDPVVDDPKQLSRTGFELPRMGIELPKGGGRGTLGMDRDVIPIVRPTPDYPPHAQGKNIEGWVQIQFSVTAAGTVRDPRVVAAEPPGEFEDAALKAIARWRYNPRIDGGVAVERVGLQTVIRFTLSK